MKECGVEVVKKPIHGPDIEGSYLKVIEGGIKGR
jgi:hypothetical protein